MPSTGCTGVTGTGHRVVENEPGNGHQLVRGRSGGKSMPLLGQGESRRDQKPLTPVALHRAPLASRSRCQHPGECSLPRRPWEGRSHLPSMSPTRRPSAGWSLPQSLGFGSTALELSRGTRGASEPGHPSGTPPQPQEMMPQETRCPRWSLPTAEG